MQNTEKAQELSFLCTQRGYTVGYKQNHIIESPLREYIKLILMTTVIRMYTGREKVRAASSAS